MSKQPPVGPDLQTSLVLDTKPRRPNLRSLVESGVEELPFSTLSKRRIKSLVFQLEGTNLTVTISTESPRGLPGPLGQDVYMGLMALLNQNMGGDASIEPPNRKVTTTFGELLDVLRMERGGQQYANIADALDDWWQVSVTGSRLYQGEKRPFREIERARVFDNITITRPETGGISSETAITIAFNEWLLESIRIDRHFRVMALDDYLRFESHTTRRLYRFLFSQAWRGKGRPLATVRVSVKQLRNYLPLNTRAPRHVLRILERGHQELVEPKEGPPFLARMPLVEQRGRSAEQWIVTYDFAHEIASERLHVYIDRRRANGRTLQPVEAIEVPWREEDQEGYLEGMLALIDQTIGGGNHDKAMRISIVKTLPADRIREILTDLRDHQRSDTAFPNATAYHKAFISRAKKIARQMGKDLP